MNVNNEETEVKDKDVLDKELFYDLLMEQQEQS